MWKGKKERARYSIARDSKMHKEKRERARCTGRRERERARCTGGERARARCTGRRE